MPTPEARIFARNALADDPGELDEDWLADQLDRFAAQRGAEALGDFAKDLAAKQEPLGREFAEVITPDLYVRSETGGGDAPFTSSGLRGAAKEAAREGAWKRDALTGGGDAGEREFARKTAINIRVQARYDELMREGKHGHYETMFRIVHEERRSSHQEGAEEARQDALRVPFTKALVAEARTQGYQEGAEAMREEAVKLLRSGIGKGFVRVIIGDAIRDINALPIPGSKTDAG